MTSDDRTGFSAADAAGRLTSGAQRSLARFFRSASAPSRRLILAVELLLVVAIGAALARSVMPWLSPLPEPPPPIAAQAPAPLGPAAALNPFRVTAPDTVVAQPTPQDAAETQLQLTLHGTWIDSSGASAIIQTPDGVQKTYRIDDAICCGATLSAVYSDRVIIMRAGVAESLRLPNRLGLSAPTAATPSEPLPQSPASEGSRKLGGLTNLFRVQPAGEAGALQFRLYPADNAEAFAAAGFNPGDVLIAINDEPAPPEIPALVQLLANLKDERRVQVTIDRDGIQVPIDVELSVLSGGALE